MLRGFVLLLYALAASATADVPVGDTPPPAPEAAREADGPPTRPLPFFYDLYTFRGQDRTTEVVAAFAVPVDRLEREHEEGQVRYRFDVTLVLSDTVRASVSRTDDSVFVAVPSPLDGNHLLSTHIEVAAPPSTSTLQRVIMTDATTPGIGQLYGSPFPIPDYSGQDLMLSDIALGLPGAEIGWTRGNVTLALLPTSQFPQGSFDVYYEVYNLPPATPYSTEISIQPLDGSGDADDASRTVRTRFSGESDARGSGSLRELRRVEATLERGPYRLTVSVTDDTTGRTVHNSREFHVRGWRGGTTLVPAMQRTRPTAAER